LAFPPRRLITYLLSFAVLCCSCGSLPLSSERPPSSAVPASYCVALNVPSVPGLRHLPKPYLGIYLASAKSDETVRDCKESDFIQVAGVIGGSPADEAGLVQKDIILSVNGVSTCRDKDSIFTSFRKMIERQGIGAEVMMDVMRGGRNLSLTAKLKEAPVRLRPEAVHAEIGGCSGPSLLEKALRAGDGLTEFSDIVDELYRRTNMVHNPGWSGNDEPGSLQLSETTYLMRHPLACGEVAKELSLRLVSPLYEEDWKAAEAVGTAAGLLDVRLPRSGVPGEITFPGLLRAMEETKEGIEGVLSGLGPEEKDLLRRKALRPWDDDEWKKVLEISLKFDRREFLSACSPLLSFLTRDNLSLLKEDLTRRFGHNEGPVLFESTTAVGKVIVGGPGPNTYTGDAALILDLGGDDLYLNNAGGARPDMPAALVVDWEGNDRYISKESFSQGAGVLGVGFLLDLSGNDTFVSLDGSQGAGFFGLGLLYHGGGDSVYDARSFSQGAGQMGIGLIMGGKGNDLYSCSHDGQGLGLFGGEGILIDEAGDDRLGGAEPDFRDPLKSTVSMGQGFGKGVRPENGTYGVPGGIGVLIDEMGDDTYLADYFAQGSSYYYATGILDDMAGNDRYIAGRYAQGAGIHSSAGVLIDRTGDDSYYASTGVAQGVGHDYGVGFFEDDAGNDNYWGGTLVQAAATGGSIGVFLDGEGKDRYSYLGKGGGFAAGAGSMAVEFTSGHADDAKAGERGGISIRLDIKKED
jgi:hypothetical protein